MTDHQWIFKNASHVLYARTWLTCFGYKITEVVQRVGSIRYHKHFDEWHFHPTVFYRYDQDNLIEIANKLVELNK